MDLPRSGYHNQSTDLLYIETNLFDLFIQGKPSHPTVEVLDLHRNDEMEWEKATLEIVSVSPLLDSKTVQVFSAQMGTLINWDEEEILPCFYETQTYELIISKKSSEHSLEFFHENINIRQAVKERKGGQLLTGLVNFQNEVGYTDLEIKINGKPGLQIRLEIFPSKMDYKKDYEQILKDVNEQVYNLSFDFLRKTYQLTGLKETKHQSLTEFFSILQYIFHQLVEAIDRINHAPHHRLHKEHILRDAAKVKKAGSLNFKFLRSHPQFLEEDVRGGVFEVGTKKYVPTKLIETKGKINYDTAENRFIKWVLKRIQTKLRLIKQRLSLKERTKDPYLNIRMENMQSQINRLLQLDFLQDAGMMKNMSVSLVLQMAAGYRDAYRLYLMLMKGLAIQSDLFRLSTKDLAQLYEYWCFLKINQLLSQKYQMVKQDIIKVNRNGLFVTLGKGNKASIEYRNPRNEETFLLHYNSSTSGSSSPTLSQRPDNVLTLRKKDGGKEKEYKYVFDAKYRINPAYPGTSYYKSYDGIPGPEEDDINTMHRYRDAIVYQRQSEIEYERSMYGAYVLFPYPDEQKYQQHKFYKSIKLINVGAIPFLPNATSLMEQFLDELILDSPEKAYERSTRPGGTTEYYKDKLSGKNVLIGSLRRASQLDTVFQHKFYHMPLENIQNHNILTQLEYIAIYQSRNLFGEQEGIRWYGKITDWQVKKRGEIKEIKVRPGTDQTLYVIFQIEKLIKRNSPIKLGEQYIWDYLLTSKYMFDRAFEIAELRLDNEEQLRDWREKRRQGPIKVKLDDEYVDRADKVLGVDLLE